MTQEMRDLLKRAARALTFEGRRVPPDRKRTLMDIVAYLDTFRGVFGAEFMVRLQQRLMGQFYNDFGMRWFERKLMRRK